MFRFILPALLTVAATLPLHARFLQVDPKRQYVSSYTYTANKPTTAVDPDGKEDVVVSGGEHNKDRYKYNFIETAIKQINEFKKEKSGEPITWLVMDAGYSLYGKAAIKNTAKGLDVKLVFLSSAKELSNYLNSKNVDNKDLSPSRLADPVTNLVFMGHGYVGSFEGAHGQKNKGNFSWGFPEIRQLSPGAFSETGECQFYSCKSAATNATFDTSMSEKLSQQIPGLSVWGFTGYTSYSYGTVNKDEQMIHKIFRLNGFNTLGSRNLPGPWNDKSANVNFRVSPPNQP
ncbi:hypothetical protein [Acanthopleuribacter pedis]|uniref:Alpha/beta hydrolase n=1 Tax=Acanthopleuribacter pedis TaxID=442870 RepID=A0A8J7QBG9_9BACT|nr:hypothetical protein [Acanthopleuribacter pedis]MBO1321039.1 hypothetical protein [Acanthopleuribacter pedis]